MGLVDGVGFDDIKNALNKDFELLQHQVTQAFSLLNLLFNGAELHQ